MKKLTLPLSDKDIAALKAGDTVAVSGVIYTARDAAHKRICNALESGEKPPIERENAVIYYSGPTPARKGEVTGSCGPTTSARMNAFAPRLLKLGLGGMVGKGEMSEETRIAIEEKKAIYFAAIGGAGAFYGNAIRQCELVAFPDLLSEAIYKMQIEDFPLVVAIDSNGKSIFHR